MPVGPYHVEGCPLAGPDRQYLTAGWTGPPHRSPFGPVAWLIDALLRSGPARPLPDLCPTCIYLTEEN